MGLFGFGKKKNNTQSNESKPVIPSEKQFTGGNIQRDVTQDVAICMNELKITTMPILKFFHNDNGIFEGFYQSHINDPQFEMIKTQYGEGMYLSLLGCHALGAGAYITLSQAKFKKPVDEWSMEEAIQVDAAFRETDPYELAIKSLGYAIDGNNKNCLDHIVQVGVASYSAAAGTNKMNRNNLKDFMQVMYNAGITLVMRG